MHLYRMYGSTWKPDHIGRWIDAFELLDQFFTASQLGPSILIDS